MQKLNDILKAFYHWIELTLKVKNENIVVEAQQFIIGHMDELFQLMKNLKYKHMGELVRDLLGEGLLEIRSRAVQIEEHERSEKDCLWQDACE